jgi:hypothetical protein
MARPLYPCPTQSLGMSAPPYPRLRPWLGHADPKEPTRGRQEILHQRKIWVAQLWSPGYMTVTFVGMQSLWSLLKMVPELFFRAECTRAGSDLADLLVHQWLPALTLLIRQQKCRVCLAQGRPLVKMTCTEDRHLTSTRIIRRIFCELRDP